MHKIVLIVILGAIHFAGPTAATGIGGDPYGDIPVKSTPQKLQDAWLRFHESGLCQDVDAAFVFSGDGMQVWSRIESDKNNSKFQKLFAPLLNPQSVTLYTNRPGKERDSDSENSPPPSLWRNYELRSNLGDRTALLHSYNEDTNPINPSALDPLLRLRLLIYAEQTLDRNRKMEQLALCIFALIRTAENPELPIATRAKAMKICMAHAKSLEKDIRKLISDLEQAIARSKNREKEQSPPDIRGFSSLSEAAEKLHKNAQIVGTSVYLFIYPESHIVELSELGKPIIMRQLRTLRREAMDFQKALAGAGPMKTAKNAD